MTTVTQVYFHLKRIAPTQDELEHLGVLVSRDAKNLGYGRFPSEAEIEVRLESGSLKGWIRVSVLTLGAYGAIADYKGLKESIPEIIKDSREYGSAALEALQNIPEIRGSVIHRTERRGKTPLKIKRYIEQKEYYDKNRDALNPIDRERVLFELSRKLADIRRDLSPQEAELIEKILNHGSPLERVPLDDVVAPIATRPQFSMFPELGLPAHEDEGKRLYINRFTLGAGSATRTIAAPPTPSSRP